MLAQGEYYSTIYIILNNKFENMELKLHGNIFEPEYGIPYELLFQHGVFDKIEEFSKGFFTSFGYTTAIISWLFVEVLAPERAPEIMADFARLVFDITGLSDEKHETNQISQSMEELRASKHKSSSSSQKKERPVVQQINHDTPIQIWYKTQVLYLVWFWVANVCEWGAWLPLVLNDGGEYYNECYYMFYNGVVWYNPPEPYKMV